VSTNDKGQELMKRPQMDAFERVLKLAKAFDPYTQMDFEETVLANSQAITLVEKWVARQKKARGWDKGVKTPLPEERGF